MRPPVHSIRFLCGGPSQSVSVQRQLWFSDIEELSISTIVELTVTHADRTLTFGVKCFTR